MTTGARAYRQTRRAEQTQARRTALVETAALLIERDGFHGLGLEALARAAGVSRRTVYNQFGSKLGLLGAVMDDLAERARAAEFGELVCHPDTAGAVVELLGANCRLWALARPLHRRLVGLAAVDPETALVVGERESRRRGPWAALVGRLEREGRLLATCSDEALRALILLSSFPSYDGLAGEANDPEVVVPLLVHMVSGVVRL
jgi:AcrR family transcriptional regulator